MLYPTEHSVPLHVSCFNRLRKNIPLKRQDSESSELWDFVKLEHLCCTMCLLLGTSGVGKTMLLKKLQGINSGAAADKEREEVPATIPTVGTNLVNINVGKKTELTVRELGGCMGPIWFNYLKDCSCLMYMVDLSNALQVSGSCIQLLTVLSNQSLADVPVLLIFNKIDMPTKMTRSEVESVFRLDEIISHSKQKITVIEISAYSGQGLQTILDWLQQNCNSK